MKLLLVMSGGFLGAITSFALGEWIHTYNGFPIGTLIINLSGCFFLGWFLTFVNLQKIRTEFTLLIGPGFVSSFTTFSTFSLETLNLMEQHLVFQGFLYVLISTILGLLLVFSGSKLALLKKKDGDAVWYGP